jgi:hypothetical protein
MDLVALVVGEGRNLVVVDHGDSLEEEGDVLVQGDLFERALYDVYDTRNNQSGFSRIPIKRN